ncbi:hypothetical protein K8I61_09695 [bacterium]|nr:hypothetical protein [bacterium]
MKRVMAIVGICVFVAAVSVTLIAADFGTAPRTLFEGSDSAGGAIVWDWALDENGEPHAVWMFENEPDFIDAALDECPSLQATSLVEDDGSVEGGLPIDGNLSAVVTCLPPPAYPSYLREMSAFVAAVDAGTMRWVVYVDEDGNGPPDRFVWQSVSFVPISYTWNDMSVTPLPVFTIPIGSGSWCVGLQRAGGGVNEVGRDVNNDDDHTWVRTGAGWRPMNDFLPGNAVIRAEVDVCSLSTTTTTPTTTTTTFPATTTTTIPGDDDDASDDDFADDDASDDDFADDDVGDDDAKDDDVSDDDVSDDDFGDDDIGDDDDASDDDFEDDDASDDDFADDDVGDDDAKDDDAADDDFGADDPGGAGDASGDDAGDLDDDDDAPNPDGADDGHAEANDGGDESSNAACGL